MEDRKFVHIPYEVATTPNEGDTVMLSRHWTVYKEGHISVYIGNSKPGHDGTYATYTPMCNRYEPIATRNGKMKAVFLPVVYLADLRQEGEG